MNRPPAEADCDVVRSRAEAAGLAQPPLLVLDALAEFLDSQGIGAGEPQVRRIGEGHSNVTYAVQRDDVTVVLRRPPRPPLPPRTHDVLREGRILRALAGHARVPRVLAECEDPDLIGMPFIVMELIDAHVVGPRLPSAMDVPGARVRLGEELVDALIELHAIDPEAVGLDRIGRPSGYLERQLDTFAGLWQREKCRDVAEMEQVEQWLRARRPASASTTIVHGDYRLGNVMFRLDRGHPELAAILDWEMATLGDPLADVGYMLAMWAEPGDEETPMSELSAASRLPGFLDRDALRRRYEAKTNRSLDQIRWYEVLALWKACVFLEGSYGRFLAGTADDPYFASLGAGIPALARVALARTRQ